ncbi:MAG: hypothetical protein M3281_08250, partial [Chloroflexota bacterium]|nr:hypothetical protein [Chloroflexota bacterium]
MPPSTSAYPPATQRLRQTAARTSPGSLALAACSTRLQALIDAAAPGPVVSVPACRYTEPVAVTRPVTLADHPRGRTVEVSNPAHRIVGAADKEISYSALYSNGSSNRGAYNRYW